MEMQKTLKKILAISLCMCIIPCSHVFSQTSKQLTNKYSMKLEGSEESGYKLVNEARYKKIIDLSKATDLLKPYTLKRKHFSSKDYKNVEVQDYIYKKHKNYELKISVDKANTQTPSPVVFYCHGGGWARGNNGSHRILSQYLAQQKGITGVRIEYTLAPQEGANVEVSMQDILDAAKFVQEHAKELNIDPDRIGFVGTSAGAHLAATAAMRCKEAKVFVGYSGIYDLSTAAITTRAKNPERIKYFEGLDKDVLKNSSPINMIDPKHKIAVQLYCGTADITVEYSQSVDFANQLKSVKNNIVDLQIYEYYDHNLSSNSSDKMEEVMFKTIDFITKNI